MLHVVFPVLAVWVNAGALTLAGMTNLVGLRKLREIYAEWDLPEIFYHSVGLLQISPEMRVYGIAIAGPIIFGTVVMLLSHERYALAAPVTAMMAVLFMAALTVLPVRFHSAVQFAPSSATEEPAAPNVRRE